MDDEPGHGGRPRSEQARTAVLHAVDDLLVEVGYAAMTMKGIAERAGVSRMTVYRWWSTKAEILFEASVIDAEQELAAEPEADAAADPPADPLDEITAYLDRLIQFLTRSPAGAAYRALLGEAQHDPAVAALVASNDVLGNSARPVVERVTQRQGAPAATIDLATALVIGPVLFWVTSGRDPADLVARDLAKAFLHGFPLR